MKILHITTHLGAGAGKAISGIIMASNRICHTDIHHIAVLEAPEKMRFVSECKSSGVLVDIIENDIELLRELIKWSDIVVLSWWNHPKMAWLLANFPDCEARMILWSHINGCHYPIIPYSFADSFDFLLYTTKYSFDNPFWNEIQRQKLMQKSCIIYGMGDFNPERFSFKTDYSNKSDFIIGYVGTLGYSKLNPKFISYCKEVISRIPNAHFVMAGDPNNQLRNDIISSNIDDKFTFTGFVSDIESLLLSFDVFGYPLNPSVYATTENSVLEAMSSALPTVITNHGLGAYLLPEKNIGLLAENPEDYGEKMEQLFKSETMRKDLGTAARKFVIERYRIEDNVKRFGLSLKQAYKKPLKLHNFSKIIGDTPWDWFLFCSEPNEKRIFEQYIKTKNNADEVLSCPDIYKAKTKSSAIHFASVFPQDKNLKELAQILLKGVSTIE